MARKTGSSGEKTAADLRAAATQLFARHGYAAVSMRQIAAVVGVQAGALYLYIADKQALLFDLLDAHMTSLAAAWADESAAAAPDPAAQLEQFVRFHLHWHLARADAVFISYMELRNLTPENFAKIEARRRDYEDVLDGILRAGVATGVFSLPETRLGVFGIIALLNGVNTWFRAGGRLSLDEVSAVYLEMVRAAVGQSPAAQALPDL